MLFGLYIANKLRKSKEQSFSKTVILLATIAVSLSITVVILSCGILFGFKKEIRDKVSGYAGHISIRNYDLSKGSENTYLYTDSFLIQRALSENNIASIKPYINKAGILKSDSVLEGLIFRGLPHN